MSGCFASGTIDKFLSKIQNLEMVFGRHFQRLFFEPEQISAALSYLNKSLEKVAYDWESPNKDDRQGFPTAPSRSTIHNWIADGFPYIKKVGINNSENAKFYQALALCGQLDVDPLAVFDLSRNGFDSRFSILRKAIHHGIVGLGAYAPVFELFEPDENWPSDVLANRFWGRQWHSQHFDNQTDHTSQNYALIQVAFENSPKDSPRAVHIAYRRWEDRERDTLWRFYGTVLRRQEQIELFNEGGIHKIMKRQPNYDLEFRTYFGGRKVEFRLVSLHSFDINIVCPSFENETVSFSW